MSASVMDMTTYRQQRDRTLSEATFQRQVIELARRTGWLVFHDGDSRRSDPGFPDLILCNSQQRRVVAAELKSMRGRVRREQSVWLASLSLCGGIETYLWRPAHWSEIVATLTGVGHGGGAA